ncbi:MAG TPA: hypothetical protein VFX23_15120, partial [Limnobacter sp.]|uniref:beta strand repeat-containing protein n=1 Tax=Limnobacter sp. TaxID=2003368 RepID=UPI002E30975C
LTQAQGSALTVKGASTLNAKAITLDQSGNDFQSTVNSTSTNGPTSLTDKNDLTLGNVNDAGNLTLTAAGKLLEQQDAAISVAGVTHLQADAISLAQANNQLSGAVHANSASGGTSIKTQGDLQLGNVNSSGAIDLSAGGNLTQANNTAVNALGGASIHAKSIDLRQAGNDFSGGVSLNTSAGDVSLFDKNDFNFASGHTNGDLSVQALGQVTEQSGAALVVTGNSNLLGNTVNVGELTNDFGGAVSASAGSGKVTIGDTNDLVIGSGHVAGDLDVHANGNVTQANGAAMSVGAATSLTAASIALDQPDNHFSGAVTANSSQGLISLSDDHDLTLGNVKSAGDLSIRAKGNLLQEDKASVVAQGLTDLHAKAVNLIQSNNDFGKAVSVSTSLGDAAIYDSNDLQIGSGSIQGQFNAHAAGAITQASGGALNVSGKTALQAQSVSVNQTGNDFKDVVNVIGTPNSVALADKNDLLIGDLHTTGNATLNALGQLGQATSTSLQVQGDTTVSGGRVVLDHAENQLLGSVSAQSTNGPVVVDNAAPLLLGNVSSAGNLTLETQGDLNQVVGSSVKAAGTTTL